MIDYFDFLDKNSRSKEEKANDNGRFVNLTLRADTECQVLIDGNFVCLLAANTIAKEKAPMGQHLIQFISVDYPDAIIEKTAEWNEENKNYLLLADGLMTKVKGKASEQEKKQQLLAEKEMEKSRIIHLCNIKFIDKYVNVQGESASIKSEYDIVSMTIALESEIIPAVKIGNSEAEYVYSILLWDGVLGVHSNKEESLTYLTQAAEKGLKNAQCLLGDRYSDDDGIEENPEKAVIWYAKAAAQNHPEAQYKIGFCYENGYGIEEDYKKAELWYRKSAELGCAGGQYLLVKLMQSGLLGGFPLDEALEWAQKAAEQGMDEAVQLVKEISHDIELWTL